ncbi:MAG: gamma-glutamyltransferase, partial [Gammaproteobacteria bacterium]
MKGAVAAGHPATAEAAAWILEAGGNAFDAALAGLCAACVAEPVLTSPGGGGFLLAHRDGGKNTLYDFFVQTPLRKRPVSELDFYPIVADFGTAQQEFHIGMGSIATPGTIKGLFQIHSELGTLPMREIVKPAVDFARQGIELNRLQAYIFSIVA